MFIWTLKDVLDLAAMSVLIAVAACIGITQWRAQRGCKHDGGVRETAACDAICCKCGKNLGFIGEWRKRNGGAP